MFNKVGLSRVQTVIPIATRNGNSVLVQAMAALTVEPIAEPVQMVKPETFREMLSKELFGNEIKMTTFLHAACDAYKARAAHLTLLLGFTYNGQTYPCELIFEYRSGKLIKSVVGVAISGTTAGWTLNARVNSKRIVWFEELIDLLESVMSSIKGSTRSDESVARALFTEVAKIEGVTWYSATAIHGNFLTQSERKVKR